MQVVQQGPFVSLVQRQVIVQGSHLKDESRENAL